MRRLLLLLIYFPVFVFSQEDMSKYTYSNAVPVDNGKVVFTKIFKSNNSTANEIFKSMLSWVEKQFKSDENQQGKIMLSDEENCQIVCQETEPLVFKRTAWILDQSEIKYRLFIYCSKGECKLELTNIYYKYDKLNNGEYVPAEELITDEYALNKKKTKLSSNLGKFRVKTIDLVDEIFDIVSKNLEEIKK